MVLFKLQLFHCDFSSKTTSKGDIKFSWNFPYDAKIVDVYNSETPSPPRLQTSIFDKPPLPLIDDVFYEQPQICIWTICFIYWDEELDFQTCYCPNSED